VVRSTFAAFADRLGAQGLSQPDFKAYTPGQIKTDLLAGLTVALALVPEAVAFAFVAMCTRWWASMRLSLSA
jgi:SulP family sulfate permease